MKNNVCTLLALLLLATLASASAHEHCASLVVSAQDAADRAEWIVEGDIVTTARLDGKSPNVHVSIENAKILHAIVPMPRFFTALLEADACFANSATVLRGKNANKLVGKRMRFYGIKATSGRGRRFFFMQPAEQSAPVFAQARKEYVNARHTPITLAVGADGWSLAQSTEGGFSIDMPGPFDDMTKADGGEPGFMLRGSDQHGSVFVAVFQPSGPEAKMGNIFDEEFTKPGAKVSVFKGADAVYRIGKIPDASGRITHGLWFRIPGGTFMLGIVTDKEHEAASLKSMDRFFNSLTFN